MGTWRLAEQQGRCPSNQLWRHSLPSLRQRMDFHTSFVLAGVIILRLTIIEDLVFTNLNWARLSRRKLRHVNVGIWERFWPLLHKTNQLVQFSALARVDEAIRKLAGISHIFLNYNINMWVFYMKTENLELIFSVVGCQCKSISTFLPFFFNKLLAKFYYFYLPVKTDMILFILYFCCFVSVFGFFPRQKQSPFPKTSWFGEGLQVLSVVSEIGLPLVNAWGN